MIELLLLALFLAVGALGFSLHVRDQYKADPSPPELTEIHHNEWLRSKRLMLDSAMRKAQ